MADEKTTPTPKVPGARTDTMHSTPDAPDRSKQDNPERARGAIDPATTPGTEGSQLIIKTKEAGTLVENIPSQAVVEGREEGERPDGDELALQPGETREAHKARSSKRSTSKRSSAKNKTSKAKADKASTSTGGTSASATGTATSTSGAENKP